MMRRVALVLSLLCVVGCGDPNANVDAGSGGGGGRTGGGGGTATGGGTGTGGGAATGGGSATGGGGGSADTTPPAVISTTPSMAATNVAASTFIQIAFSEAMNQGTVMVTSTPSISLGTPSWNSSGTFVSFMPTSALTRGVSYTLTITGQDLAGNALQSTTVSFSTEAANDTTPPTVIGTVPVSLAAAVTVNTSINVVFSEAMNPSTVTVTATPSATFGTPVWNTGNNEVTLTPTAPLTASTGYSIAVNGRDAAGNQMAAAYTFTFTTAGTVDATPPTITSTTPANNAMGVATSASLSVTFSEAMDTNTVTLSTTPAVTLGTPTWSNSDRTVTYAAPAASWASNTSYTVNVAGADVAGNALGAASFTFKTIVPADTTPPVVQSTTPSDLAMGVPVQSNIQFVFSEAMDPTVTQAAFSSSPAISNCVFTWLGSNTLLECNPGTDLMASTMYTVTLAATARDAAGNTLAMAKVFTFTTAAGADTTAPTLLASNPDAGAIGVPRDTTIQLTFSEPMNKASAQTAFQITVPTGLNGGTFAWNTAGTQMTYTLPVAAPLAYGTSITWQITNAAQDLAGNTLASTITRTFRVTRISTLDLYSCGLDAGCVPDGGAVGAVQGYMTTNVACSASVSAGAPSAAAIFGDNASNLQYKGFLTFDLTPLTTYQNVVINQADLNAYQYNCTTSPYSAAFGTYVRAVHVDYGPTVTVADCDVDFPARELTGSANFLSVSVTDGIWKSARLTTAVRDDFASRATRSNRSQYVVRMATSAVSANATDNSCRFYTGYSPTVSLRPYMRVVFEHD